MYPKSVPTGATANQDAAVIESECEKDSLQMARCHRDELPNRDELCQRDPAGRRRSRKNVLLMKTAARVEMLDTFGNIEIRKDK